MRKRAKLKMDGRIEVENTHRPFCASWAKLL
jgi:hypothetical protein